MTEDGTEALRGWIHVAPRDRHLLLAPDARRVRSAACSLEERARKARRHADRLREFLRRVVA